MAKHIYTILLFSCCIFFYACTKQSVGDSTGTRLKIVKTNVLDSFGNDCNNCFFYQVFKYDDKGRLAGVKDSAGDVVHYTFHAAFNSPTVYTTYGFGYSYYTTIEYSGSGNLFRAGRDSFIYNSQNQIIQRYRRVQCETCKSYLYNNYTYDTKGRLIADSNYTGQTFLFPVTVLNEYSSYNYDAGDNVIQADRVNVWNGITHSIATAVYDNKLNPYKNTNAALIFYLAYGAPFLLSTNNVVTAGYVFEYYDNGLPKKITCKGHAQEFFYE